jgi:uncharacterized protein YdcH (DUF465 family)
MSHLPQDRHDVFPNDEALLRRLKMEDHHFQTLAEQYSAVDRELARIGVGLEPASDARTEDMKKERLRLLDSISGVVAQARTAK